MSRIRKRRDFNNLIDIENKIVDHSLITYKFFTDVEIESKYNNSMNRYIDRCKKDKSIIETYKIIDYCKYLFSVNEIDKIYEIYMFMIKNGYDDFYGLLSKLILYIYDINEADILERIILDEEHKVYINEKLSKIVDINMYNYNKVIEMLNIGINKENGYCAYIMSFIYLEKNDYINALKYANLSYKYGYKYIDYLMGRIYELSDIKKALKYYKKSINNDDINGLFMMGLIYNIDDNINKATKMFEKGLDNYRINYKDMIDQEGMVLLFKDIIIMKPLYFVLEEIIEDIDKYDDDFIDFLLDYQKDTKIPLNENILKLLKHAYARQIDIINNLGFINKSNKSECTICYTKTEMVAPECKHKLCINCVLNIINDKMIYKCPFCRCDYDCE